MMSSSVRKMKQNTVTGWTKFSPLQSWCLFADSFIITFSHITINFNHLEVLGGCTGTSSPFQHKIIKLSLACRCAHSAPTVFALLHTRLLPSLNLTCLTGDCLQPQHKFFLSTAQHMTSQKKSKITAKPPNVTFKLDLSYFCIWELQQCHHNTFMWFG